MKRTHSIQNHYPFPTLSWTVEVKKKSHPCGSQALGKRGLPRDSAECSASPLSQALPFVELTSTLLPWEAPSLNWLD